MTNKLTDTEILEILNNKTLDNKALLLNDYPNDVFKFIETFHIESGNEEIQAKLLFGLYKKWSLNPVSSYEFATHLQYFVSKNELTFNINYSTIKLSHYLIKYLKSETRVTKSAKIKAHFNRFLKKYSIKSGTFYTTCPVLYWLYDSWCYSQDKEPKISLSTFNKLLKLFFKYKRPSAKSRSLLFAVDHSILNHLTLEVIQEIQKGYDEKIKKTYKANKTSCKKTKKED